jgi:hypothetical protein
LVQLGIKESSVDSTRLKEKLLEEMPAWTRSSQGRWIYSISL